MMQPLAHLVPHHVIAMLGSASAIWPAISGLLGSSAIITAVLWWFDRRDKKRAEREQERNEAIIRQRKLDETWFQEARSAYERLDKECGKCNEQLDSLARKFYRLMGELDSLADQSVDGKVSAADLRAAVRIARQEPD